MAQEDAHRDPLDLAFASLHAALDAHERILDELGQVAGELQRLLRELRTPQPAPSEVIDVRGAAEVLDLRHVPSDQLPPAVVERVLRTYGRLREQVREWSAPEKP